ncbi:MAG: MgtC/SapB family protein [Bacteriovoracaceae bacterium]
MSDLEVLNFIALKMFYAVLCGSIVGIERKINFAPAGFKTQILVCVGSMLFTSIPIIAGEMMIHETARVIAQIITGVGFLGAGAIMNRNNVKGVVGLTTAAWIWFTAAIGILIGINHGPVALFVTFTLVGVISFARYFERKFFKDHRPEAFSEQNEEENSKKEFKKVA